MSRFARLAAVCLLAGVPLYWALGAWPATPDGWLHLQRVRALGEALGAGVLYPRWFPDFAFGYGYPVLNYYAPGFYVGPALLAAAGLDVVVAVRLSLAAWFGLSAVGMTLLLRRWAPAGAVLVGVVLFLVFPYRLYDLFVRGALPEFAAFLWLPFIVYWTVWGAQAAGAPNGRGGEDPGRSWREGAVRLLPAALGWAGLVLTHNLTALMAGVTALVVLPVLALFGGDAGAAAAVGQQGRPRGRGYGARLLWATGAVVGPLLLGALLSAWYWAPAIVEAGFVGVGAGAETGGYANHFATFETLFTWAPVFPYPDAAALTVPLPGWLLLLGGLAAGGLAAAARPAGGLAAAWRGGGEGRAPGRTGWEAAVLAGALVATVVAVWLTTASSSFVWEALAPVLGKLQFPWRWQAIVGASVPLLLAVGWAAATGSRQAPPLDGERPSGERPGSGRPSSGLPSGGRRYAGAAGWAAVAVLLLAYSLLRLAVTPASGAQADITPAGMWAYDRQNGQVGASWTAEFLPNTVTEQRWAIGREPGDGSSAAGRAPVALRALPLRLGYLGGTYGVGFDAPGRLIFHQFHFPAWRVTVDGAPVTTQAEGALGLLAVDLPAGEHTVTVAWEATAAVWGGRVLTATGWAIVFGLLVAGAVDFRRRRLRQDAPAGTRGAGWGQDEQAERDGRTADEQTPDEQAPDGQAPDGQTPDGQTADGQAGRNRQAGQDGRTGRTGAGERWGAWAAVAAWLCVGIVLLLGASGVTLRSSVPQPVGADFGPVRLEAAEVGRARPGTAAEVRLHWSIAGPVEPLVAYVHVVDAAGTVVAQDDRPLGGEYTPAERWLPGLLLAHTHSVLLPANLAPGEYQVLAGVYRPGDPGAPLVAEGMGAARMPAGVLEVRP